MNAIASHLILAIKGDRYNRQLAVVAIAGYISDLKQVIN
ncbi:hypothetical protein APA_950 [Pseudanabaena sp. lw0831]|nr:hypothetical protein APA_950 [Pseudanabaena sp. lw0831]